MSSHTLNLPDLIEQHRETARFYRSRAAEFELRANRLELGLVPKPIPFPQSREIRDDIARRKAAEAA